MDKRVTSPIWGPPAPRKQALRFFPCKVNPAPESENFCLWNLESGKFWIRGFGICNQSFNEKETEIQ